MTTKKTIKIKTTKRMNCPECGEEFYEKDFKIHNRDGLRHREKYLHKKSNIRYISQKRRTENTDTDLINVFDSLDGFNDYSKNKIAHAKADLMNIINELGDKDGNNYGIMSKNTYRRNEEFRYRNERNLLLGILNTNQLKAYNVYRSAFGRRFFKVSK
jgi:hypothetical protein